MAENEMSDRDWIKANPTRSYRIRRRGEPDARKLCPVTIVKIRENRRGWSERNIVMRDELPNSDSGAEMALEEFDIITGAQIDRLNGRLTALPGASVTDAVLANLRQKAPQA